MKAAADFRVFWDNAYMVHHLTDEDGTSMNDYIIALIDHFLEAFEITESVE